MNRCWGAIALLVLNVGFAGLAYGAGGKENPNDSSQRISLASGSGIKYSINVTEHVGVNVLNLGWEYNAQTWADSGDSVSYAIIRDAFGCLKGDPVASIGELLDSNGTGREALAYADQKKTLANAKVYFGELSQKQKSDLAQERAHKIEASRIDIPLTSYGTEKQRYVVLLIHGKGRWERIEFSVNLEFFPGEAVLFATKPDLPYYQKCLAFLDTFFSADPAAREKMHQAARQLYPAIQSLPDGFWQAFAGAAGLDQCQNDFRVALARHLEFLPETLKHPNGKPASLPYLKLDASWLDSLYGPRRAVYVSVYLRFLFSVGKPPLSCAIYDAAKQVDPNYRYDWKQYEPISDAEGSDLAKASLRYLTWGVEYTLTNGNGPMNEKLVFGADQTQSTIADWLDRQTGDRTLNYLPQGFNLSSVGTDARAGLETSLGPDELTSPYSVGRGNPLPYVYRGIDSPRTFAYKMREQYRVREWYRNNSSPRPPAKATDKTTRAMEGNYKSGYVDLSVLARRFDKVLELDSGTFLYSNYSLAQLPLAGGTDSKSYNPAPYDRRQVVLKPFLPGMGVIRLDWSKDANAGPGPYNTDKLAGVDSMGLLVGSIAMTGFCDRVLGVFNGKPTLLLDRGYQLASFGNDTPSPGYGGNGTPVYYASPTEAASCLSGAYRLGRVDLERCTVLVPDLSDLRKGDLIIQAIDGREPEVGIVVGFLPGDRPTVGADGSQYARNVILLSVNRDQGRVFLSQWDWSVLTKNGTGCQIRRLLKLKSGGNEDAVYAKDPWELLDVTPVGLNVELTFGASAGPWIPNTGELLKIEAIKIKKQTSLGTLLTFAGEGTSDIAILGPYDYGFRADEAGDSNIINNKGADFEFCAIRGATVYVLATFHRQADDREYAVDPAASYFDASGRPKVGCSLKVDVDHLTFTANGVQATSFGIRALGGAAAPPRPGDDLLLRFGLLGAALPGEPAPQVAEGAAADRYRVAVYDKKLLWRANLYIDEGEKDWNNLNKWVEGNEWNVKEDGSVGDGGQVVEFPDSTWPGRWNVNAGIFQGSRVQSDRVPYDYWSHDSPREFVAKANEQRTHLQHSYNSAGVFGWLAEIVDPAQRWQHFPPPPTNVSNYLNYAVRDAISAEVNAAFNNELSAQQTVSGCYPYVPTFTYWYENRYPAAQGGNRSTERKHSAGLDCVAFVHQALSYSGEPYTARSGIGAVGAAARFENNGGSIAFRARPGAHKDYTDLIAKKPEAQKDPPPISLNRIVPGDVIWYVYYQEGTGGANDLTGHIGIVADVTNRSEAGYESIRVIESVYGLSGNAYFGAAVKNRTLADVQAYPNYQTEDPNDYVLWRIGRLKQ